MTLIKSISGIRGTIGGVPGENLTPPDIVMFTSAYAAQRKARSGKERLKIIVGRDARVSGEMVSRLVTGTLMAMGIDVYDGGLSTTPTIEMAVTDLAADGGIILTASHNPEQWNALKLLDEKGEFLSDEEGKEILEMAASWLPEYGSWSDLGKYHHTGDLIGKHIDNIIQLEWVDTDKIKAAGFTVAIDCVNSTGGLALPPLLKALGVKEIIEIYTEPNGLFPHNPEPLAGNVDDICSLVKNRKADLGFVVDPDVDRLAIITENGEMFGEEYTLVAVADYILSQHKGPAVSNLSSSRALKDVCDRHGVEYYASAVGEVNVVKMMKETGAVIGGEGNGGVILPELHYGRDAMVGIALFLSHLARTGKTCSELRQDYPDYKMVKDKIPLTPDIDTDNLLKRIAERFSDEKINTADGVRIDFSEGWVHLRKSNTEPIIRVYSEAPTNEEAVSLVERIRQEISKA